MTATTTVQEPRARGAAPAGLARRHALGRGSDAAGRTGPAEGAQLAGTVGRLLREAREAVGFSAESLARGMGAAGTTITRLERGERRPRAALLADAAAVLHPRNPGPLMTRLAAAAGDSLRADTPASLHQRARGRRRAQREQQALWARASRAQAASLELYRELAHIDPSTDAGLDDAEAYFARRAELEREERFARHAAQRWPRPPYRWEAQWR